MMSRVLWFILMSVLVLPAGAQSPKNEDLAARVARLESRQSGQALIDMLDRIDRLQNEVQQLRGETEQIRHDVDRMQDRQQSLYLDLDKRLLDLERAGSGASIPPSESQSVDVTNEPLVPIAPPPPPSEPAPQPENTPLEDKPEQIASAANNPEKTNSGAEENLYQEAFVYLNNGRYDDAIADFTSLVETYPDGEYADNAQYWLGETYYVKRDFDTANSHFNLVLERYPESNKAPDAMLKLGYIEYEQSKWKSARKTLNSVIERYPESNSAQLAQDRLDRMRKEGH